MSMSNEQVVERTRDIKARRTGFDQIVNEVQASNAVDSPAERPPVADAVTEPPQKAEQGGDSGGCGGTFMKIFTVIVAAVVSYFVPAAAPVMAQMAASALSVPEEGAGTKERDGVSEDVQQTFRDIEDKHYGEDGIAGTDDDPYGECAHADATDGKTVATDTQIDQAFDALNLGEPEEHFRAFLQQETGLGPDATWTELLAAYANRNDSGADSDHVVVSSLPDQKISEV